MKKENDEENPEALEAPLLPTPLDDTKLGWHTLAGGEYYLTDRRAEAVIAHVVETLNIKNDVAFDRLIAYHDCLRTSDVEALREALKTVPAAVYAVKRICAVRANSAVNVLCAESALTKEEIRRTRFRIARTHVVRHIRPTLFMCFLMAFPIYVHLGSTNEERDEQFIENVIIMVIFVVFLIGKGAQLFPLTRMMWRNR